MKQVECTGVGNQFLSDRLRESLKRRKTGCWLMYTKEVTGTRVCLEDNTSAEI